MKKLWGGLMVLSLSAFVPALAAGQGGQPQSGRGRAGLDLGQNYPNPVNSDTRIPFTVGDAACSDPSRLYRVSLRIYNVVAQLVAVPVLQGGTGNVSGGGEPIENLYLTCNQYTAYWDATYRNTGQDVANGVYLYRLEVDGKAVVKKMLVQK
jgi:hypothetical protein